MFFMAESSSVHGADWPCSEVSGVSVCSWESVSMEPDGSWDVESENVSMEVY